ncbi:HAD family acid phosphatase [Sphingomonas sp. MMS24-J13]|uniref:HAD family acid phosphatase n=1 Tax=Sphingomonas sp. MMS24-J13 TaxID=3238686 RepID=UPI00384A4EC9
MSRRPVCLAAAAVLTLVSGIGAGEGAFAKRPARQHSFVPPEPPAVPQQLHGIQYLFGSGEAAALSRGVWHAFTTFVDGAMTDGKRRSVVLAPDASLADPHFPDCGSKPPAIVLDVDETSILNLGAEYDDLAAGRKTFNDDAWDRWEKTGANYVLPTPGAREALDHIRALGVTVIFNTNRALANAAGAQAAIDAAGLGPARHGETLFLMGDDATGSRKDGRRQTISARYCVLAMGGDQLGDFTDLFNTEPNGIAARRAATALPGIAELWGNGWFVLPNPVYGSALQGGSDEIFPKDKQWRDPGPSPAPYPVSKKVKH